jgi:hypothetical protein
MSTTSKIGKLERVPLGHVWRNEASDFTRWLRDNIHVLNDVLKLTLGNPGRKQPAGHSAVTPTKSEANSTTQPNLHARGAA